MRSGELLLGLGVVLALGGGAARADDAVPAAYVGRVAAVSGPVQYQASDSPWADALVNEPVMAGTALRSRDDGEAELHLPGLSVALAGGSEVRVLRLDAAMAQIAAPRGRVGVHVGGDAPQVEIDLPGGGVWLTWPGDYAISAGSNETPARVEIFAGKAALGGGLDDKNLAAAEPDAFTDRWLPRDAAAAEDAGHLPANVVGAAALAAGGRWSTDPTYGDVWYPNEVADDWAPYRDGVWRFLPSGWTWIDAAAWGFAPSHYGRWVRIPGSSPENARWAWVPPAKDAAAGYSPAAVAFLGTAPIGLSCPGNAGPAVAWFPLAPGETVGDGNEEGYKNRTFATAVPRAVFAGGRPVAAALVDLPEQRFADAPVILGPLGIAPVVPAVVAAAAAPKRPPAAAAKPAAVVAAVPPPAVRKPAPPRPHIALAARPHKRLTIAATPPAVRMRTAPSTAAARPPHNRQHFAAHGGAL